MAFHTGKVQGERRKSLRETNYLIKIGNNNFMSGFGHKNRIMLSVQQTREGPPDAIKQGAFRDGGKLSNQINAGYNNPEIEYERQVINRVKAGDFAAVEELYNRYSRQAFGLALKMLNSSEAAEDAVQDAFLRFWKQPASFDQGRGRFVAWLLSVVHNLCIDQLRRKANKTISLDKEAEEGRAEIIPDESRPVEEEVWLKMQRSTVRQALSSLPYEQRFVIELAYFKGLTQQEIAEQTGQPLGTVKSRVRQGLLKLRSLMSAIEIEPGLQE